MSQRDFDRPSHERPHARAAAGRSASTYRRPSADRRTSRNSAPTRPASSRAVGAHGVQRTSRSSGTYGTYGASGSRIYSRRGFLAAAGVVAVGTIGVGSAYAYAHRDIAVMLNGQELTFPVGTTLRAAMESAGIAPKPGNLLSLGGAIAAEGGGTTMTVSLNGDEADPNDVLDRELKRGDAATVSDGADVTEDFTTDKKQIDPKLVFKDDGSGQSVQYVSQWGVAGTQEIRTGKVSGEVVEGDMLSEAQDCIVTSINVKPDGDAKIVGLSFDDGPSEYTQRYLDILKEFGATATFFNIGRNIDSLGGDLPAKVIAAGCSIGSHTYSHPPLTTQSSDQVKDELSHTRDLIEGATNVRTSMLRPPYGDFSKQVWLESAGLLTSSILWTQDTLDWKQPGADTIAHNALSGIRPGSIILMHDGGGKRDQDLDALPKILKSLTDDGYKVVSIQELLASDTSIPHAVAEGTATLPDGAVWPTEIA